MAMRYQIAAQERDATIADKLSGLAAGKGWVDIVHIRTIATDSGWIKPITDERNRLWGNGFPCKSATASAADLLAAADELDRLRE